MNENALKDYETFQGKNPENQRYWLRFQVMTIKIKCQGNKFSLQIHYIEGSMFDIPILSLDFL